MRKPVVTLFFQFNPWRSSLGGIQTIVRSFIKYAPPEFDVRLVGTGDEQFFPARQGWQAAELEGRELQFLPLFDLRDDNRRKRFPTTLQYTLGLLGRDLSSDFLHFHRLEPTLAALSWRGEKMLFLHNDIQQYMTAQTGKQMILWRRFPHLYFALESRLVRQFDRILSCHMGSLELYQQRYPDIADRVNYIKNSVDGEIFYPLSVHDRILAHQDLATRLGLSLATQFVLFAGRLHPQKDPLLLLSTIAALNNPQVHLLIAGDGELRSSMETEVRRLNIVSQVTFVGAISQTELANLHRVSSAFLLTSHFEGLPLVVLETLACGTPVVSTNCGETPKLLGPGIGVICPDRAPSSLAEALNQVLHQSRDYPLSACIRAAGPYMAKSIVLDTYQDMFQRWEQRQRLSISIGMQGAHLSGISTR